jgi:aminoglycoside phosphotransferase (APT) family kinase protein
MTTYDSLSPEIAASALTTIGVDVDPAGLHLERRGEKWLVRVDGERIAWFAATESTLGNMERDRRLLRLLETRCRFRAPRVLAQAADGSFDVRLMVPGVHDPYAAFYRVRDDADAAALVGTALGAILGDLHTNVAASDVAGWVPARSNWPEPRRWIADRLPQVVADRALHARADTVIARYEAVLGDVADADRALAHTDFGFHNISIDPTRLSVHGVFDWESACWADPHLDFRYLVFDVDRFHLLDATLAEYESRTGRRIARERVMLYNAACAISYLAFRAGVAPNERWCGRTLTEDLEWTARALDRVESS